MRNKNLILTFLCLCLFCLNACVYTDVKYPLDKDVEATTLGTKTGKSSFRTVLWLFAWGDASTDAAAKNGEIKTIRHLDSERFVLLFGLYTKVSTIAYGD